MAEPEKQQIGDGSDNYGQAAGQMAKAAKQAGQEAAKQTAAKGAEATANAAAATVKASVKAERPPQKSQPEPLRAALGALSCLQHGQCAILFSRYWYVSVCFCYS